MATVKILNNIFDKEYKTFSVDKGATVESIIRGNVDENTYNGTLIECYDLETGKTYFAPIEDDNEILNAIVQVNGKDALLDYEVEENDIVEIIITPAGGGAGGNWSWIGAVTGALEGAFLGFQIGGMWQTALVGGILGFIAGGIVGGMIAQKLDTINNNGDADKGIDSERLPDVRGATNQPLTNQPFPMVLGKHAVAPFVVGSPYNDISGAHGDINYINVLYVVGYAPLRLTDFKLGEQYLAHNKPWSGNPGLENIFSGQIYGTDPEAGAGSDLGEIANVWKNNDVAIEILQQHPDNAVDYGDIYPYAKIQKDIKANVLFIADGSLEEIDKGGNISYKGLGLQNGLRNNPIYFSEQYPKSLRVELDFPQGLYKSRSETVDGSSKTHYSKIPMWLALQWRVFSEDNPATDGATSGELSLPTWNPNTETYELISGKALRGWNTFETINKAKIALDDNYEANIKIEYAINYRHVEYDTNPGHHGNKHVDYWDYEFVIKKIYTERPIPAEFSVKLEFTAYFYSLSKKNTQKVSRTITFPANTTELDVGQTYWPSDFPELPPVYHPTYWRFENNFTAYISTATAGYKGGKDSRSYHYMNPFRPSRSNNVNASANSSMTLIQSGGSSGGSSSGPSSGYNGGGGTTSPYTYNSYRFEEITINVRDPKSLVTFTALEQYNDIRAHSGQRIPADINAGWLNKSAFNLEDLGGDDNDKTGINEFRCTSEVDLVQWAKENLRAPGDSDETFAKKFKSYFFDGSNTTKRIEVRVVRISPNYIDETVSTNEHSAYKFNDVFMWNTLTSEILDADELMQNNKIVQKRPLSEDDMRKLCVVALKARTDNVDQLSNTIKKFSCVAQSFAPYYNMQTNSWVPANVKKEQMYAKLVEEDGKKVWSSITKEQYYEERQNGNTNAKCFAAGNDFVTNLVRNVIGVNRDSSSRIYIPENSEAMKYCENNVASGFLYAGIGPHLGKDALGYTTTNYDENGVGDFDMGSLATWYKWARDRTDGTTYKYDGHHYNRDGQDVPHYAGQLVHVFFSANAYIYQPEILENLFSNIAIAGQAVYTRDSRNRLRVVVDKKEDYPVALFNQKNILKSSHSISYAELPSGIQVTFPDEDDGYENNQIYRMVDGEDEKNPLGAIEPYGFKYVTNNNQIWFLAGYLLANRILNKEAVTVQIGAEGATLALGDIVLYSSDTMLIGTDHGGRITKLIEDENSIYGFIINDAYHLKGEEDFGVCIMQPSKFKEYRVITLRIAPIGTTKTVNGETYTSRKGKTNTVLLETNIAKSEFSANGDDFYVYKPEEGNLVSFGKVGSITAKYRIIKIKPSDKQKYDFTLLKYDEGLYDCGEELPSFQNHMTLPDRNLENIFRLNYNVSQKQLIEAITESTTQAKGMIDQTLGAVPSVPTNLTMTVDRDKLDFSCVVEAEDINNIDYVEYEITRANETTITVKGTYTENYYFNRQTDGFPEASALEDWTIRARAVSIYTDSEGNIVASDWTEPVNITTASLNNYGTWIPAIPSFVSKIPGEGGIVFNWNQATVNDGRTLYGTQKYTVTVIYEDMDHSVSQMTLGTLTTNTNYVTYNFNRASNKDGYPEAVATADYKGLNKYSFKIKTENESGNYRESSAVVFSNDEVAQYGTWIPAYPVFKSAYAEQEGISINWDVALGSNGRKLYGGVSYKAYVIYNNNGVEIARQTLLTDGLDAFYNFNRQADGYPEKQGVSGATITLNNYAIKLQATSTVTNRNSDISTGNSLDVSHYKTWKLPTISVGKEELDRTVILSALYGNDDSYGTKKLLVKIKRIGNQDTVETGGIQTYNDLLGIVPDSNYYKPAFDLPTAYSSNTNNEGNYRTDDTEPYEVVGNKLTHTLPLIGQTARIFEEGNVPIVSGAVIVTTVPQSPSTGDKIYYNGATSTLTKGKYYVYTGSVWNELKFFTNDVPNVAVTPQSPKLGDVIHWTGSSDSTFSQNFYYQYNGSIWEQVFSKTLMVPTLYKYSIQMTNESGNVSNEVTEVQSVEATVRPTNISDIVQSHEHYKNLYVEKLSAINANIGMISQGGMGTFDQLLGNYWALSNLSEEDTGIAGGVKQGSFRVGGSNEYFKVTPDPLIPDKYSIELKAGNIELTTDIAGDSAMDFQNGTYVYNDKKDSRLRLSPSGISAEKLVTTQVTPTSGANPYANGWYVYEGNQWVKTTDVTVVSGKTYYEGNWQQMAKIIVDDKGNTILTNSDTVPPLGIRCENADIYHLEDASHPEYAEDVTTNPQSLTFSGSVDDVGNYTPILDSASSSKCFNGTIAKNIASWTGRVAFFSKSDTIVCSEKGIKVNGSVVTMGAPLTGFNEAMRETSSIDSSKSVGAYLGLNSTQIQRGIFY